jgi:hypothetical protein
VRDYRAQIAAAAERNPVAHREKDSAVIPEGVPEPEPALVLIWDS